MDMYHLRKQLTDAEKDKTTFVNYYIKFTNKDGFTDRKTFTDKVKFEKYAEAIKNADDIVSYEISVTEKKVSDG